MLAQLQQLINNSNELGKVSITAANGSNDGTLSIAMTPIVTQITEDNMELEQPANQKPVTELTGDRQSTHQQFYETKMTVNATKQGNSEENATGSGEKQQQDSQTNNNDTTKGSTFSQTTTSTMTTTATTLDSPTLVTTTSTISNTVTSTTQSAQTFTLPSGIVVNEHEVMQQLVERFQILNRPSETRLNIKLHPAELGELKIDLRVHDGAVRANVMAQSQQVQEIIEKNMAKLRTILEDQGFTIDEIAVATQSETIDDFNQFDNHFFNDGQFDSHSQRQKMDHSITGVFDAVVENNIPETNVGVNVTA